MKLRFREDRRTLVWAFVLFPLVPALAFVRPALWPWLIPLALYNSYCSGVLAHNHTHSPTFVGRRANAFYGAWLSACASALSSTRSRQACRRCSPAIS